nr:EAL domain-containing protein [Neobacillus sp. Marseille-Q6967]
MNNQYNNKNKAFLVNYKEFFRKTGQSVLELLQKNLHIVFWSYDVVNHRLICTEGLEELYGLPLEKIIEQKIWQMILGRNNENLSKELKFLFNKKEPFNIEYKFIRKDGSERWMVSKGTPVLNFRNEIIRLDGYTYDITDKKLRDLVLQESEEKYRNLVDNYALGVYISQDGRYRFVNNKLTVLTGYNERELLEMDWSILVSKESQQLVLERVSNFLIGRNNGVQEILLNHKNGSKIPVELHSTLITFEGKPALMGTLLDISERNKNRELVNKLAYYDNITGIPNRNLFYKKANEIIKSAHEKQFSFALMFLDLDNFKMINDTFGHQVGDELIKKVSDKLSELVLKTGFLARIGGDEFVILLTYRNIVEVEELAKSIIKEIPSSLSDGMKTSPSIGISTYPKDGIDITTLLRCADIAMYQSKRDINRSCNYKFFNISMDTQLRENILISDAQKAINEEQFYLVYQPKVELVSNKIIGVEALIRWNHPTLGQISPVEFIPLLERTEDIVNVGEWVIRQGIDDIKKINQDIMLNINISAIHFLKEGFVEKLETILKKADYSPPLLNIEITESVALYDIEKTVCVIKKLRELGVLLSLDDFGTGYSSLNYLSRLPVDFIKIDQSFVKDMEQDESKKAIIQAIIKVAQSLKLQVIAEGVETSSQRDLLLAYQCDKGQGYFFSKPLEFANLITFLHNNNKSLNT